MAGRGKALEARLDQMHQLYLAAGKAWVVKAHPEARVIGRRQLIYSKAGPPDFLGCLAGGRIIAIEAKEIHQPRWQFNLLELHQAGSLDAVLSMGGLSYLVICWDDTRHYLIAWGHLREDWYRWHTARGRPASIKEDDPRLILLSSSDWLSEVMDGRGEDERVPVCAGEVVDTPGAEAQADQPQPARPRGS